MKKTVKKSLALLISFVMFSFGTYAVADEVEDTPFETSDYEKMTDSLTLIEPDDTVSGNDLWIEEEKEEVDKEIEIVTVMTEIPEFRVINVVLPIVEDKDPFNFFIDPNSILFNSYKNSDSVYVEEGAHLLFINREDGVFGLSSMSDKLKIVNKSTVAVDVTITARIENIEDITLVESEEDFSEGSCDLLLVIVDDEGNELPLLKDGEVSMTVRIDQSPMEAYAYEYDEETQEYEYACLFEDDNYFATYSFGLRGAANSDGDWTMIKGRPNVSISWNVEPVE